MTDNPYATPVQPMSPKDEKLAALLVQLVPIFMLELIGPIVGFIVLRDKGPFIKHHVTESLNFSISVAIYTAILCLTIVGLLFLWVVPLYIVLMRGIASYKTYQGAFYKYPLIIRFIK